MNPHDSFIAFSNYAYRAGKFKSHEIVKIGQHLGFNHSSKTVMKWLRNAGFVRPTRIAFKWSRRGKTRNLLMVAQRLAMWMNYARSGGEMNFEAILADEKPP